MTKEEFVRIIKSLSHYSRHSWIDFEILPDIACSVLEEFPELDKEEALRALDSEVDDVWEPGFSDRVRKFFGPRFFIVKGKGGARRYWANNRKWNTSITDATRFDSGDEARNSFARECGAPPPEDAVLAVAYPEWTSCENLP